jgi:hypothetical protein
MVPGAKDMRQEEQSREEAKPAELAIFGVRRLDGALVDRMKVASSRRTPKRSGR